MNVFAATRYMRELLRGGDGQLVVVNRDKLRAVVKAAEASPRFHKDRLIWRRFNTKAASDDA